jgi:hypothetical protein
MACWFAPPHTLVQPLENSPRALDGIRKAIAERAAVTDLNRYWTEPGLSLARPIRQATYAMVRRRSPSHSPAPPRCPSRAVARYLINVGPEKGLARKQIAPAFSARARMLSSGKAVMKMNGTR